MNAPSPNLPKARNPAHADIAAKIALAMRAMGIYGLPRNYEILHEVFAGANPKLNADFASLGSRPRQEDLDRLTIRYFPHNNAVLSIENVHDEISRTIDEISALCARESLQLERYGSVLDETAESLERRQAITGDILERIARIVASTTDTRIESGRHLIARIADGSAELEVNKFRLEEYRRLAHTDPLTQIANRRAFDEALARVYSDPAKTAALLLLDIDHFKIVNDRFGHPAGDRILKKVAQVMKACVPDRSLLARIGGEEFALIVDQADQGSAMAIAEELRGSVRNRVAEGIPLLRGNPITVSAGACLAAQASDADDLFAKADSALYRSKKEGRDRCSLFAA